MLPNKSSSPIACVLLYIWYVWRSLMKIGALHCCMMDATWPGTNVENLLPFEWKASCGVESKLIVELRVETSAQDKCLHFQVLISGQNLPCSSPKLASQVSASSSWNISYKQLIDVSLVCEDVNGPRHNIQTQSYDQLYIWSFKKMFWPEQKVQSGQLCQSNNTHPTDQNFFVRKQSPLMFWFFFR